MQKHFILIDGHAVIYRAYHAFRDLATSSGELVNAVYGFSRILLTVMKDLDPEYIAVTFDDPTPTFRHAEFAAYKATRAKMPEDLRPQIDVIKRVVTAFNIPQFILPGYEADDLIGTLATQVSEHCKKDNMMTIIVTGDRDSFQLVDDCIHIWMPARNKQGGDIEYDAARVKEKMSVRPDQIIELKALMGDSSDNIPGVRGIGEKTATTLINTFNTVDGVYAAIDAGTSGLKGATLQKLIDGRKDAYMSRQLATIDRHVPITLDVEACRLSTYKKEDVTKIFEELEFTSLIRLLPADEFELGVQSALF